jgi:hypothetical protein
VLLNHFPHLSELLPADKAVPIQVKLPEGCLHPVQARLQLCGDLFLLHHATAEETRLEQEKYNHDLKIGRRRRDCEFGSQVKGKEYTFFWSRMAAVFTKNIYKHFTLAAVCGSAFRTLISPTMHFL